MLADLLMGAFVMVAASFAVMWGLSCIVAREFWWRLYNRLSWSALVGKTASVSSHRPLWWDINLRWTGISDSSASPNKVHRLSSMRVMERV